MPAMAQDGTKQGVPNPPRGRLTGARARERGQILVMAAVVLTAMIGVLGLAIDLGYSFSQRRNSQNAADAGALAGARAVASLAAAGPKVNSTVASNAMGSTGAAPTVKYCIYVGDGYVDPAGDHTHTSNCDGSAPTGTSGVHVHVEETHNTFFMPVLGIDTATTSAKATANVRILLNPPSHAPFLVCGIQTARVTTPKSFFDILIKNAAGNWVLNPAADGLTFYVLAPAAKVQQCNSVDGSFQGFADTTYNKGKPVAGYLKYNGGPPPGQIAQDFATLGVQGCKAGQAIPVTGCVMILPIVRSGKDAEYPEKSTNLLYAQTFGAFHVTQGNPNEYHGKFLFDYSVQGPSQGGWTPNTQGSIIVVRLME